MRRNHPQYAGIAFVWVTVAVVWGGCQSNQRTASTNPFVSPSRVPPPSTQTISPGAAQPYYPGDPIPTMQSTSGAPSPKLPLTPSDAITPVASNASSSSSVRSDLAYSSERSVSIPSDNGVLRFEQVAAAKEPAIAAPASSSAPIVAANHAAIAASAVAAVSPASATSPMGVQAPGAGATQVVPASASVSTSPWRPPRISPTSTAVAGPVAVPSLMAQGPLNTAPSSMNVQLRAVPSPAPGNSASPRVRIPSYSPSAQYMVAPGGSCQQVALSPTGTPQSGAVLQTLAVTPLASPTIGYGSSSAIATASQGEPSIAVASGDGFRPRGSTR